MGVRKLHMRQAYRIIPVYTADVSGVCSALYELGGMVVMHDPSGCNSTYNTHDEIRWYDKDSLIYISGLSEIDAVMGNDAKFINDIEEAARELKPEFIALAGSPIPFMNGTDFPAIAQVIQTETGIPSFAIPTNGMITPTGQDLHWRKLQNALSERRKLWSRKKNPFSEMEVLHLLRQNGYIFMHLISLGQLLWISDHSKM